MKIKIYQQGDSFFSDVLAAIEQASESIFIEMYKFNLNGIGKEIAQALINKAKAGINITILVDGIGSKNWGGPVLENMSNSGIKTKIYHPIPWQFHKFKHAVSTLPNIKKIFYLFAKINTRNHRKAIVIDQKTIFLGSINISDDHVSKQGKLAWSDCAIKFDDVQAAQFIITAFKRAFAPDLKNIYQGLQQTITNHPQIILNNNLVKRKRNFRRLLKRIRKANTRVWLVSAYFAPNNALLKALIGAANRGVDVRLILPKRSDIAFMSLAAKYFYNILLDSNVKIFEYQPTMIHSKYMLIDNWSMVGSSNLNHRSIMHDLELDFQSSDHDFVAKLELMIANDQKNCTQILNYEFKTNWFSRLIYRFVASFILLI